MSLPTYVNDTIENPALTLHCIAGLFTIIYMVYVDSTISASRLIFESFDTCIGFGTSWCALQNTNVCGTQKSKIVTQKPYLSTNSIELNISTGHVYVIYNSNMMCHSLKQPS